MKKGKQKASNKSASAHMRRIIAISMLFIVVDVFISLLVMGNVRKQNSRYMSNMAELYIQEQDRTFFKLSRQMLSILMGNEIGKAEIKKQLSVLENSQDPLERNVAKSELKKAFMEYAWDYGTDYQFFAYLEKNNTYIELNSAGEWVPEMEEEIPRILKENAVNTYSAKAKWTSVELFSGNYILKVMENNGKYLGCFMRSDVLLKPIRNLNYTKHGFTVLIGRENQVIAGPSGIKEHQSALEKYMNTRVGNRTLDIGVQEGGYFSRYLVIEKAFDRAPFSVLVFVDNIGIYEKYFAIQVALIVLGILSLGVLTFIMQYVQRRVLRPIQQFTDNLLRYDESDDFVLDITSNDLKELEQANEQFRNLLRQIKRLKITLYEKELDKQKIQMDYLQMQIRPHFYLNCLNFIFQMVDLEHYEDAKKMSVVTSDYLRYLFQSDKGFVEIQSELKHVENYLKIQKMRYREAFTYYMEQEEETFGYKIPPLMIQTFAENSVRHTISGEMIAEITILVCAEEYEGEDMVHISISDTGTGFPKEVLLQLNEQKGLKRQEDGHRTGITNCLKRMDYFYHGKGKIKFYNNPMGGAVVDMYLPMEY